MDRKDRHRLYKSGKRWLAVLLVTAAIGGGVVMTAPAAQAAKGQPSVVQSRQDDPIAQNVATLRAALEAGGWGDLSIRGIPVSSFLEAATNTETLNTAWYASSGAVYLNILAQELNISGDVESTANQALIQKYFEAESPIEDYHGKTNRDVIQGMFDEGIYKETSNPTPAYSDLLKQIVAYAKKTAGAFAQANWERSKGDLAEALTAGNYNDLETPNGTALKDLVAQVADETSLNKAWQEAAAAIKLSTAQKSLGLSDTTSPANKRKLEKFWAMPSTAAGHEKETNDQVVQGIVAQGTASAATLPDYAAILKNLADTIDWAAKTPIPEDWQINRDNLAQYLTANQLGQLPSGEGQETLSDVVQAITDDASASKAWTTAATVLAKNEARQKLGLSDMTSAANQKVIETFLAAKSTDSKYATNAEAIAALVAENAANPDNLTPVVVDALAPILTYVDNAVKAMQGTVVVKEWLNGTVLSTRTIPVISGQSITITPTNHSGLVLSSVYVDGRWQATTNGQFTFTQATVKPGTTYAVNYYFTAVAPPTPTWSEQAARGEVYIKNPNGAMLYSDMHLTSSISGRVLPLASAWDYFKKVYDEKGNLVGYNLGGQQYVKAGDVQETPVDRITIEDFTGVARIVSGDAQLYANNAFTDAISGRTLSVGSRWKVYQKIYINGVLAGFNLGGKQYVQAAYVTLDTFVPQRGIFTVRYPAQPHWGIAVYNGQLQVQKIIPAGSQWQVFGVQVLSDGRSYYNLGGNQWVPVDYGNFQTIQ